MSERLVAMVREALRGDRAAVRALIDALSPVIQARVARILLRRRRVPRDVRQEVADLVQDVFVALFADDGRALRAWDPARGMSLPNFVGLLAEREVIAVLRSKRRSPWTEEPVDGDDLEQPEDSDRRPDRRLQERDALRALLAAVKSRLGDRGLLLFQWLLVEERPVGEVCEALSMTPDAVYAWKSRLGKIAHELGAELASEAPGAAQSPPPKEAP